MLTTPLPAPLGTAAATPSADPPLLPVTITLPSLYQYLAEVPDPRDPRGLRHPLVAVLGLVCCALFCGARQVAAITEWGRNHSEELTRALGFTRPKTPCQATLHTLLSELDWTALEAQLRAWVEAVEGALGPTTATEALAVDGKTLRGALKMEAKTVALVSAVGHRLGLTSGATEVVEGDEVAAVEALLREVVIAGRVVTLDALHTQVATAQLIRARGGHYVMAVKGNQPILKEEVTALFAPQHHAEQERERVCASHQAHGRTETRRLVAVSLPEDGLGWPGAKQAFLVERQVWKPKQQRWHRQVVYGITSLSREEAGAPDLLRLVRGHWAIENRSHWVRDVVFGEDASLCSTGKIPQTLALLRMAVLSRLRGAGVQSVARETRRLAVHPWDCLRLLGVSLDN